MAVSVPFSVLLPLDEDVVVVPTRPLAVDLDKSRRRQISLRALVVQNPRRACQHVLFLEVLQWHPPHLLSLKTRRTLVVLVQNRPLAVISKRPWRTKAGKGGNDTGGMVGNGSMDGVPSDGACIPEG